MSKTNNLHDFLKDIADEIRLKKGYSSSTLINPQNFRQEINSLTYNPKIYGVRWVNGDSTTMTRTDDSVGMADPLFTVTENGYGVCDSPFDDVFPWNESAVETIDGNKFLHMPEMWFRVTVDNTDTTNPKITAVAVSSRQGVDSGDSKWYHTDEFWYGCYGGSVADNKLKSVSGVERAGNQTRLAFNNLAKANNIGDDIHYHQLDLYHHTIMLFLWMIEFGRKDTNNLANGAYRGVINGSGTIGGTSYANTGLTDYLDSLGYASGYEPTRQQMRWHHIEDFVGNKHEWVDGFIHVGNNAKPWATSDPSKFTNSSSDMAQLSYHNPGSARKIIRAFGWDESNPFLVFPNASDGEDASTGFGQRVDYYSDRILYVGASAIDSDSYYGVFLFDYYGVSSVNAYTGARLLKV